MSTTTATQCHKCAILRNALVSIVGVDGEERLEDVRKQINALTDLPEKNKTATLKAIDALLETLPLK